MKKIFLGILTFVYISVTSGIIVNIHYCMGRLAAVEYGYSNATNKCGKCGMDNNGCCHNESKYIKITDDQQSVKSGTAIAPFSVEAHLILHHILQPAQGIEKNTFRPYHSPPGKYLPPVYLINCVFRI
ncbi:MAG TPA: hypothetical protein VMT76_16345 [Puia sp.]|nr:hypothetical protein [Puia sp.]